MQILYDIFTLSLLKANLTQPARELLNPELPNEI